MSGHLGDLFTQAHTNCMKIYTPNHSKMNTKIEVQFVASAVENYFDRRGMNRPEQLHHLNV